jgi:hypothetical protein
LFNRALDRPPLPLPLPLAPPDAERVCAWDAAISISRSGSRSFVLDLVLVFVLGAARTVTVMSGPGSYIFM